jgi:outer membrane immunogenic protein
MKRIHLASICVVAFAALSSPVHSADMRVPVTKAPAMVSAPPFSWTGCYVGANAAYGWGVDSLSSGGISEGEPRFNGWLAGGQAGCDSQFSSLVIGIQGMYDFADLAGNTINPANPASTSSSKFDRLATATLRLGYAFDRSLFFAGGGLAWVRGQRSIVGAGFTQFTDFNTKRGAVIGAGWEYVFAPNWSMKIEWNHFFFDTIDESIVQQPGGAVFVNNDKIKNMDTIMLGVNYRFNSR